jgi:hypothetical protein
MISGATTVLGFAALTNWLHVNDISEWERIGSPSVRGTEDEFAWKFLRFIFLFQFLKSPYTVVKLLGFSIFITMTVDYLILMYYIVKEFIA